MTGESMCAWWGGGRGRHWVLGGIGRERKFFFCFGGEERGEIVFYLDRHWVGFEEMLAAHITTNPGG